MTTALEILGALLLIAGVAMIYIPAALILAGTVVILASFALDKAIEEPGSPS